MSEMKKTRDKAFCVGDKIVRVRNDVDVNTELHIGSTGTIISIFKGIGNEDILQIKWDNFRGGHNLDGRLAGNQSCSGWNVPQNQVDILVDPISIDISDLL